MSFATWNVMAGETPTEAKWNILGDNDDEFHALIQRNVAGTGVMLIDSSGNEILIGNRTASAVNEVSITNAATAGDPNIAATGGDTNISLRLTPKGTGRLKKGANNIDTYEEIGRATQTVAGASLSVSSLPLKKYLKILFYTPDGTNLGFQFNGDTGNNYGFKYSTTTGQASAPSQNILGTMAAGPYGTFGEIEMINIASVKKIGHLRGEWAGSTAASAGDNSNFYFAWHNSSNAVSSILMKGTSGNIPIGAEIIVYGHD